MLKKLTKDLAFGDQASPEQLAELKGQGFKAVIDLCTPQEGRQIPPAQVQAAGLELKQFPVAVEALNKDLVKHYTQLVKEAGGPVYTRCASGKRAGLLALLSLATEHGWSEHEFFEQVKAAGFDCASAPGLAQFAMEYIQGLSSKQPAL
ncbi:MAG TPA: sulfur transferase domain-containing protein [Gammaproteobacteria bacterium]|nr:sulfur transferase domain-containing protein [Gammaproteobacteria bacterium]